MREAEGKGSQVVIGSCSRGRWCEAARSVRKGL